MTIPSKWTFHRAVALAAALAVTLGPGGVLPLGMAGLALAQVKKGGATVTVNFVNADIEGVARAMSAIIDRQIMVDPRVKGTVTLYSEQPLTPREAYLNFLAALRGQGFALVEVAGLLKVVPEADAKLQTGTVGVGNAVTRSGDQILTQIFRLQYENANNLVTVLRPLISPNNTINANPTTNALVITDYADNLRRLGQIIAAMDVPGTTDMEAITLQYAIASDLAPMVQRFADSNPGGGAAPGGGGASSTLVMADPRTNTLMVRAPNPARLAMLKNLIQRLDKPGSSGVGGSGIHVVYLRNADAVKLAQVLRAAFPSGGGGGGASGSSGGSSATAAPTTPTASTTGLNNAGTNTGSSGTSTQSTAPVAGSAQPSTGGFIQADPASNSLIITAPDALYRQLRAVIDQLDGRRAQIYIEAMVVEVSDTKLAEIGVQWQGASGNTGSSNIVGVGTNLKRGSVPSLVQASTSLENAVSALTNSIGLNIGVVHNYGDGRYGLAALASFLETKANGNVLSKPNMIALDNEEAKIVVGRNVPFVTGQYTNGATSGSSTVNPFTTVERKDVGLVLRVRPQVGEGNSVRMTVYQENSNVDPASRDSKDGLETTKSSIETTVVVDDGQTLVLGGLLSDRFSNGTSQVPLLGDLPVVGNLFKSRSRTNEKSNLMIFLRPVVMRTQEASNALTLDRYDYMRQRQMETQPTPWLLPINEAPLLDPLKLSSDLSMPSVRQPLDDPNAAPPAVAMPPSSGYAPRLTTPAETRPVVPPAPVTQQPLPAVPPPAAVRAPAPATNPTPAP